MRYVKILPDVLFFLTLLPGQAMAHNDVPPIEVGGMLWLIIISIIIFTFVGGGYYYMEKPHDKSAFIILVIVIVIGLIVSLSFRWIIFIFLCCAAYAIVRGIRMIQWGFIEGRESGKADHFQKARPWRLKLGGWLLVGFTLLFVVAPLTFSPTNNQRYNSYAKRNLHNLYLGCKAYWADNNSRDYCTVDIVSQTMYGYVQSPMVIITGSGDVDSFLATADHSGSGKSFTIDHTGNIKESKASLQKESDLGWVKRIVRNVKENVRMLGF